MKKYLLSLLCVFGIVFAQNIRAPFSPFAASEPVEDVGPNTNARLVAETEAFVPGETLMLGLVLEMKDHWHTYWQNPGDAGMPTSVNWELPEGFEAGEIIWPTPERFVLEGLVSFGYEDKVILQVPLKTPANFPIGESISIQANVSWLECKEVCLPGSEKVSIQLQSANEPGSVNAEMDAAKANLNTLLDLEGVYESSDQQVSIKLPAFAQEFTQFFPLKEGAWVLEPTPVVTQSEQGVEIILTRTSSLEGEVPVPQGILVNADGEGYAIAGMTLANQSEVMIAETQSRGVLYYLGFAFLAGIGMNLLPCIFPVLGLKISGFVEQAQGDPTSVKAHALVFAAGVVISLWILAAVVGLLGAAWGAQFQDPRVVIVMLLVLTFFTMNLFGVFELGNKLTTVGGGLNQKQGYAGSFFQGVLLTVIGTPCTGPVLAVVIVWMLTQPLLLGFLAFTLMGIGMALPYVALAYSPKLIEKLPRPGTWMITFKKASAFMIVLFLWVLLYVLKGQISSEATIQVVGAMLLVCFSAWVLGTWAAPGRSQKSMRMAQVICLLLLALSVLIAFGYKEQSQELDTKLQAKIEDGTPIRWTDVSPELAESLTEEGVALHYRPYTPELVSELQAQGKTVFVDFTADWCTICKINKFKALHKEEVMKAFQESGVVTLRADWTARDPVIANVLESYGRRGVPVYLMFEGVPGTRAELLPEKLSPEIIYDALDNL